MECTVRRDDRHYIDKDAIDALIRVKEISSQERGRQ